MMLQRVVSKWNLIYDNATYIPVKNCNIVHTEADVAIMSLNPSIANLQSMIPWAKINKVQTLDVSVVQQLETTQHT